MRYSNVIVDMALNLRRACKKLDVRCRVIYQFLLIKLHIIRSMKLFHLNYIKLNIYKQKLYGC